MDYNDINENDLVVFEYRVTHYENLSHKGYVLFNDKKRKLISIRWFGLLGDMSILKWHITIFKYEDTESHNFSRIGVSKYPTIYRPAFYGILSVYGFWWIFGSFITNILQLSALGFGGALAFIIAKNFKKIPKIYQKNVTVLSPVKNNEVEECDTNNKDQLSDKKSLKLISK